MKKFLTICFSFFFILNIQGCENTGLGWLDFEEEKKFDEFTIRWQIYPIKWYWDRKSQVLWCRSPKTLHLKNNQEYNSKENLTMNEDGWFLWGWYGLDYDPEIRGTRKIRIPWERVHRVNSDFLYIDLGRGGHLLTLDGCASALQIWSGDHTGTIDRNGNELIRAAEWDFITSEESGLEKPTKQMIENATNGYNNPDQIPPPLFAGHSVEDGPIGKRNCLTISSKYLIEKIKKYEVCTEDLGRKWFTRLNGVERVAEFKEFDAINKNND